MKDGKVIVGFSAPFVGLYNNAGGTVTYTNGMRLARGVGVSLSVNTSDDNNFYADGVLAESDGGTFRDGVVKYTVDGLHDIAERFIYGLPEPEKVAMGENKTVNITKYGKKANPPYVGTGFIIHYRSDGVDTYQPMLLPKVKFISHNTDAKTKEKDISWQTQDLEATICRDDTADQNWKWLAEEQASEEAAISILTALLGVGVGTEAANG